ncbi:NAD-dependent epimerase/dehydratase family protein [candidate division KSB1 bacterium]
MFFKDKKVLVTGATGFVGIHILQELMKQKAKIRAQVHNRPLAIDAPEVELVKADMMNLDDCKRICEDIDYVFHGSGAVAGAAVVKTSLMHTITVNLIQSVNILEAAWEKEVKRIQIFSSSTGYPVSNKPVKEEEFWSAEPFKGYYGYGWMRRYLELIGDFVTKESDTKVVLVRPTAPYGRHDNFNPKTAHVVPSLIRKAVEKMDPYEVWGTGEDVRDFLHISDLARGCLMMVEKDMVMEPINIGLGEGVTLKQILPIILKAANHEDAKVVFNADRPSAIPFRMVDISKSKEKLGFEPQVSLEEGLSDTVKWFAETQGIKL